MKKREAVNMLRRLLLVVERLPEDPCVIRASIGFDGDETRGSVHLTKLPDTVLEPIRTRIDNDTVKYGVEVSGVWLFTLVDERIREGA